MSLRVLLVLVGVAGVWVTASASKAADCAVPSALAIQVDVVATPLPVKTDFSEAELRAMSPGPHRHAPLGYYSDKVGYRLTVHVLSAPSSCPAIAVSAQLVQVRQEIQIARELRGNSCLFETFVQHYRHHADAARATLSDIATGLPAALRMTIAQVLATTTANANLKDRIEGILSDKLDAAVAEFTDMSATLRDKVDSPGEIDRLQASCGAA